MKSPIPKPTFIDLFCGCGGFTLGMERAEFQCLAAIDFNKEAVQVFKANFPKVPHALEKDLTKFGPKDLASLIGTNEVDVIVGGPPCQGFSQARQRDGANHGPRLVDDPRRHLYREYLRFVDHFRPKVFVMENVLGIQSAGGGEYYTRVQAEGRKLGYRVFPREEHAEKLGVPQKRKRQLFIGIRLDVPGYLAGELVPAPRAVHGATLGDAIMDLPPLESPGGSQEMEYDMELRERHVKGNKRHFIHRVLEVSKAKKLTAHISRRHSDRDLRDFMKLKEGENCKQAMQRGEAFEFPYDKENFQDRYTRQSRFRACSTIVAHLSKDGLMFVHPTQQRSLTPREAARVQTFPDWFQFPVARTHQYRVIGNAVPPLVGEAVGHAVANLLDAASRVSTKLHSTNILVFARNRASTPKATSTASRALAALQSIAAKTERELRSASKEDFYNGWVALLFLFPELHPDNARDHGSSSDLEGCDAGGGYTGIRSFERSGWPVSLALIGKEGWRRFEKGDLSEDEFYPISAHLDASRYGLSQLKNERSKLFA